MYIFPTGPTSLLHLLLGHPIQTLCCMVLAGSLYLGLHPNAPRLVCCRALDAPSQLWSCAATSDPAILALVKDMRCGDWSELFGQ